MFYLKSIKKIIFNLPLSQITPNSFIQNKIASLHQITWIDFIYHIPEIFLAIIIAVALVIIGTSNFFPANNSSSEKKKPQALYIKWRKIAF